MKVIEHLYIHVPFCPRVCPYCAFYVVPADRRKSGPLVEALLAELRFRERASEIRPRTIYLGGGTPSALSTGDLARLIGGLGDRAGGAVEFTIEVNPTTLSPEKAGLLRSLGVNRASLGAQSFDVGALATLGRQHGPERIRRTFEILRGAGFGNIGVDLIHGVPGQAEDSWWETLDEALGLHPEHLSAYGLTYEEDTPFFDRLAAGEWVRDEALEIRLFLGTRRILEGAGYVPYEVSNFALPGFESEHNLAYWRGRDYLGLGPSAVSTIGGRRWRTAADLGQYLAAADSGEWPEEEVEYLDEDLRRRERMMFGLRTREGVDGAGFEEELAGLREAGYADLSGGRWRLTAEGLLRADAVGALFARG
ncbi:MAG TPA: radical SAM family heme chaperone HemW [Verrucomicrobiae bacterium]|nr:radical SAM family heme chaperone HemW [Verrucomicrobiae bacterium]